MEVGYSNGIRMKSCVVFAENAKWILNVQWEMDGVDIHVDTNIGKHLSALANTLTSLASSQDAYDKGEDNSIRIGDTIQVGIYELLCNLLATLNYIYLSLLFVT